MQLMNGPHKLECCITLEWKGLAGTNTLVQIVYLVALKELKEGCLALPFLREIQNREHRDNYRKQRDKEIREIQKDRRDTEIKKRHRKIEDTQK